MDFRLRQATPEDAEAVVLMQTLAHEECYRHLLSPEFFQRRRATIPERVERRRAFLATDDPRILAFDAKGQLAGYADAGPGREDDAPEPVELYSIYTLRRMYGTGLGVLPEAGIPARRQAQHPPAGVGGTARVPAGPAG